VNKTYNPILEVRELRRVRFKVGDLRAKAHTTLVLVSATGKMLKVGAGEPVPQVRMGDYREAYFVDVAEHQLQMECKLPSSDGAFSFNASVSYRCKVAEPEKVVAHRCTDAAAVIEPVLRSTLRGVARKHTPDQSGEAEADANDELLGRLSASPGFHVSGCSVELSLDGDEAAYKRKKRNAGHRRELDASELAVIRPLVESGDDGLLALYLIRHPDDAAAVVDLLKSHDHASGEQRLEALRVIFSKPGSEDDFDMERVRHSIASTIADELRSVRPGAASHALSRGRLRGTLLGEASDSSVDPADSRTPPYRRGADEAPRDPDAGV
jgi:SPFH domain / Band 7 family